MPRLLASVTRSWPRSLSHPSDAQTDSGFQQLTYTKIGPQTENILIHMMVADTRCPWLALRILVESLPGSRKYQTRAKCAAAKGVTGTRQSNL